MQERDVVGDVDNVQMIAPNTPGASNEGSESRGKNISHEFNPLIDTLLGYGRIGLSRTDARQTTPLEDVMIDKCKTIDHGHSAITNHILISLIYTWCRLGRVFLQWCQYV
jgi:hypothetical protein